jgi:hypothetical protein
VDHVLSSFTATQGLPSPSLADIQDYRSYLATHSPIEEIETRFLDPTEDLVSLARPATSSDGANYEDAPTPMPRSAHATFLPSSPASDAGSSASTSQSADHTHDVALPHLAVGMAVAVLLPILTFPVVPSFVGRMVVVLLVGLGVLSGSTQAGFVRLTGNGSGSMGGWDWLMCAGVYGGVMAVVASLFG